jgi:hypothetical protein
MKTCEVIEIVMRDERFHGAYRHDQLECWTTEGFGEQVKAARRWADPLEASAFRNPCVSFGMTLPRSIFKRLVSPSLTGRSSQVRTLLFGFDPASIQNAPMRRYAIK